MSNRRIIRESYVTFSNSISAVIGMLAKKKVGRRAAVALAPVDIGWHHYAAQAEK